MKQGIGKLHGIFGKKAWKLFGSTVIFFLQCVALAFLLLQSSANFIQCRCRIALRRNFSHFLHFLFKLRYTKILIVALKRNCRRWRKACATSSLSKLCRLYTASQREANRCSSVQFLQGLLRLLGLCCHLSVSSIFFNYSKNNFLHNVSADNKISALEHNFRNEMDQSLFPTRGAGSSSALVTSPELNYEVFGIAQLKHMVNEVTIYASESYPISILKEMGAALKKRKDKRGTS